MDIISTPHKPELELVVRLFVAESVTGDRRKMLETGLSLLPGLQRVQRVIEGVEHVSFRTTRARARIILESVPPEMSGVLVSSLEHQTQHQYQVTA